ncbi:MAG TPA: lytic transglycosylase domain-containing protein [Puia sp.]|jgi:membrane-bound lytic murein transglycosylase D|nr:lytic transglycosylase domain-containing protein [Puia sp.]
MLKTKLAKAFYLCNSFLFISTSFTANQKLSPGVSISGENQGLETASFSAIHLRAVEDSSRSVLIGHNFYVTGKSAKKISVSPNLKLNKKGMQFVRNYLKSSDECLVGVKKRSKIPFFIIDSVFNQYGLPVELKYLAVIESELKPSALSHVGARGPWQLMPGTAHDLGLKTSRQNDERINYYKSTRAAAIYLRDLYAQFGDWLLVLAAYNGGPKPVFTAIHKSGSRNFWALQNYLPAESREHVKKFIATHYYFEGRGSVTTLTRAENMANMKKGNALAKTGRPKRISMHKKSIAPFEKLITKTKDLAAYSAKDQKNGPENTNKDNKPENDHRWVRQYESSDQKFRRLMKESSEALKRSNKLI